jgi:hypothetical protein
MGGKFHSRSTKRGETVTAAKHEIEVELDEQGFLKLVRDSSGVIKPKTRFMLEVKDDFEPSYTRFGSRYAALTPAERAADFLRMMEQWRNDPNRPKVGLTDEQLKREHIYEDE